MRFSKSKDYLKVNKKGVHERIRSATCVSLPNVNFTEECKKQKLKRLDAFGKFKKTSSYIKNHRQAIDYLGFTKKENKKYDAKYIPLSTSSKVQIESLINLQDLEKYKSMNAEDIEEGKFEIEGPQLLWASPTSSDHSELHQIEGILALRNAKTGIFLNETKTTSELPFYDYNPRKLEKTLISGPPYEIKKDSNCMFVKIPDSEYSSNHSENLVYTPSIPYIYAAKMFSIPPKEYLEKGTQIKSIFANKAVPYEIYCPNKNRRLKSIATIYIAYATLFIKHPKTWNTKIINKIIDEGENHWKRSILNRYKNPKGDFDILEYIEESETAVSIKKILQEKFDNKLTNLFKIFTNIFQKYSSIIFQHKDLCILIVKKTENIFYMFDPNGRSFKCNREVDKGKASLITVQSIEGLIYLIYHHSWKQYPTKYFNHLYRIYKIGLTNENGRKERIDPNEYHVKKRYCVINRYYAVITGTIGIEAPKNYDDKNASMVIACITLLYSCIDSPQHWEPKTINALIQYGVQYYGTFMKLKNLENVQIKDLPPNLVLGAYSGQLFLLPYFESGFIENISSYRRSSLRRALLKYFQVYQQAILQIDNTFLALWKDEHFFYVFDPIQRNKNGLALEEKKKCGGAILQIHINFESMCKIIYLNSLKIITAGYFYLHGCTIQKVNILTSNKYLKSSGQTNANNYYENLNIFYPNKNNLKTSSELSRKKAGEDVGTNVPLECLSNLSIKPCQRACSESEFLEKQKIKSQQKKLAATLERSFSIKSIDQTERIKTPDTEFVTEIILADILDLIDNYVVKTETKLHDTGQKAKAVLLKTDLSFLDDLKIRLQRGETIDDSNDNRIEERLCKEYDSDAENFSTNFVTLLNGTAVILGQQITLSNVTSNEMHSMLLRGVTSAYGAIICARKYKISTWNSDTVNCAMKIGDQIESNFSYDSDIIQALINNNFPEIQIGDHIYNSTVKVLGWFYIKNSYSIFKKNISAHDKIIVLFSSFSCAVIRRNDEYYIFFGVPCNEFGYRTTFQKNCEMGTVSRACLLKFDSLKSCVDRIISEKYNESLEKFLLISVKPHQRVDLDVTNSPYQINIFKHRMLLMEENAIKKSKENYVQKQLDDIEKQKNLEIQRIKAFNKLKNKKEVSFPNERTTNFMGEKPEKKHIGQEFKESPPMYAQGFFTTSKTGFNQCEDNLFRLSGNYCLEDNNEHSPNSVSFCHFASVYAILQAIITPIQNWNPKIIDRIIDNSKILSSRIETMEIKNQRFIENLEIDNFTFNICIVLLNQNFQNFPHIKEVLCNILKDRKYLMLQCGWRTFSVCYDKFFYCFDAYSTKTIEESENTDLNAGASWLIFANFDDFQNYITKVIGDNSWELNYNLYYIDITSFKEIKSNHVNFMHDPFTSFDFKSQNIRELTEIKSEKSSWTSLGIPIWSRKNKRLDFSKLERGNMMKDFEIEIVNDLYSLFGTIHPKAIIFKESFGKQYLAINVIACCVAHLFRVTEWNSFLLDTIVIHGDRYHNESFKDIKVSDFEIEIEYLNTEYKMDEYKFDIGIKRCTYGIFFCSTSHSFNLSRAMIYFFKQNYRYGIVQIDNRCVAFGLGDKGYFMYDCQCDGPPLFDTDQGASYCLLCHSLYRLIYCITVALNVRKKIEFLIYAIQVNIQRDNEIIEQNKADCQIRMEEDENRKRERSERRKLKDSEYVEPKKSTEIENKEQEQNVK